MQQELHECQRHARFSRRALFVVTLILVVCASLLYSAASQSAKHAQSKQAQSIKPAADSELLEVGSLSHSHAAKAAQEIKVVSYNIRWRGGEELRELIKLFKEDPEIGGASLIGLQEVDRDKKRTGNENTIKVLAAGLGKHYAWAAPPPTKPNQEEETGVALLSDYPLADVERILLPHKGPGGRRRVAVGATITIEGTPIRFYSIHAETRMGVKKRLEQFNAVLEDLSQHHPKIERAIVVGDLNTWQSGAVSQTSELFTKQNFITPFAPDQATFLQKILLIPIKLKLDWVWLRGLEATSHGIDKKITLSDHWPLWANIKVKH